MQEKKLTNKKNCGGFLKIFNPKSDCEATTKCDTKRTFQKWISTFRHFGCLKNTEASSDWLQVLIGLIAHGSYSGAMRLKRNSKSLWPHALAEQLP